MPTNDDTPILEVMTEVTSDAADLLQVFDVSQQKMKTMSLDELILYVVANTDAVAT